MEFGRVSQPDDSKFDLPKLDDRPLLHSDASPPGLIRVGAPTWSNLAWKNLLYPAAVKRSQYLNLYGQQYSTVEMNSSFYAIPLAKNLQTWADQVPADFKFCPKIPKVISHQLGSREVRPLMLEFLKSMEKLGGKLGPLIFQLPPHFEWSGLAQLKSALALIPLDIQVTVEFRHPSWFFHNMLVPPVFHYLQTRNVATAVIDVLGHRNLVHASLTADFMVVRWMGADGHPSDSARLHQWSERLAEFKSRGVKDIYFFIHQSQDQLIPWSLAEFAHSLQIQGQAISRFWEAKMNFGADEKEKSGLMSASDSSGQLNLRGL